MDPAEPCLIPLGGKDRFFFSCHPKVSCFNQCCQDLHQVLTPEDMIRLKNHLGLSSGEFLERHTRRYDGPETGLPVVALKPVGQNGLICPFVSPEGCRVYPARPISCRLYPVARVVARSRETGRLTEHYALIREPHCKGFGGESSWSLREWIENQLDVDMLAAGDRMISLISLKNRHKPGPLDFITRRLFHLALYDMDGFREKVFAKSMLAGFPVDEKRMDAARSDDWALLDIGYEWVRKKLFLPIETARPKTEGGERP